jgi:protein phosphatase PTC1
MSGGLLNKMFGTSQSPSKDDLVSSTEPSSTHAEDANKSDATSGGEKRSSDANSSASTTSSRTNSANSSSSLEDGNPKGEKKRRSSGVGRAREMFSAAKASLKSGQASHPNNLHGQSSQQQSPIQKLGKTDPALSVPQGTNNNSAGESHPGPRSTFRVGVTEDKNKKCRRTMEDTHSYLYNFLYTPAPALAEESSTESLTAVESVSTEGGQSQAGVARASSDLSNSSIGRGVVETDNGYFAIFDGHAGTFAADWCGKKLHIILEDLIRQNPNTPVPELLDQTFTTCDQQLEKLPLKNSGCTAVAAVLRWEDRIPNSQSATGSTAMAPAAAAAARASIDQEKKRTESGSASDGQSGSGLLGTKESIPVTSNIPSQTELKANASRNRVLYTANVGDARIVLCRSGKALRLSYDHKGSDENEGKRVTGAGGLILNNRVNGVLAVTRALGDAYMKDLVTGHPYTTETVIQPEADEFIILACDGVRIRCLLFLMFLIECWLINRSYGTYAPIKKP